MQIFPPLNPSTSPDRPANQSRGASLAAEVDGVAPSRHVLLAEGLTFPRKQDGRFARWLRMARRSDAIHLACTKRNAFQKAEQHQRCACAGEARSHVRACLTVPALLVDKETKDLIEYPQWHEKKSGAFRTP